MNLCKTRTSGGGGGISARTKSLREKFSSKRSYSELTFKDSTSSTSLTDTTDVPFSESSFNSSLRMTQLNKLVDCESIQVPLPKSEFNAYNLLPEEAYCSALDINCSNTEPRFPWQRDAAVQCDLDDRKGHLLLPHEEPHKKIKTSPEKKTGLASLSSFRFWKSSSPLNVNTPASNVATSGHDPVIVEKKPTARKRLARSVLQRAASFDSKGYSRLIQQASVDSAILPSPSGPHLDVPESHYPPPSSASSSSYASSPVYGHPCSSRGVSGSSLATGSHTIVSPSSPVHGDKLSPQLESVERVCKNCHTLRPHKSASCSSAPGSKASSPPSSGCERKNENNKDGVKKTRKGRLYDKSSNSAPNSFEDGSPIDLPEENLITKSNDKIDTKFNFNVLQDILDFKIKEKGSTIEKQFLLSLPSTSLSVHGKDVSNFMNLPSPNLHAEGQEADPVFKKLAGLEIGPEEPEQEEPLQEEPPASALHRRRALVPPKLITDGYESCTDDIEQARETSPQPSNLLLEPNICKSRRRSSIVVIPPMQICPGDLLVYSNVLNQRNDILADNFDGSTQCLAVTEDANRKGKNTWSLLKLFDRSNRIKSDSLCGLEEVLSTLTPSVFVDEQLSKYKGITWSEFESIFEERRGSSIVSGHRLAHLQSESRRSSGQSSIATVQSAPLPRSPPKSRPILLRTHTFDNAESSNNDDNLLAANAHSVRSNSCIAPVTSNIRRLSGGIDLKEELNDADNKVESDKSDLNGNLPVGVVQPNVPMFPIPSSIVSSTPSSTRSSFAITRSEYKRREALWDLFQSESVFLYCHLMVLKNVFMEPLKKIQVEGFAMFAEPEVLFGNLDELCCVTYAFCKEFLSLILQQMNLGELNPTEVLVKIFQKSSKATALTQAYHRYTLNYINALNYLETLRRQVEFIEFEKWCSRDPRCKKLQLQDLLVSPVQHIMRVPLILKDIEMRTEDVSERELIAQIIESEETSLRELDDKMKWLKNFERLLDVQRNIVWPAVTELDSKVFIPESLKGPLSKQPCERLIVSPRRQIIIEGPLNILDSGKPIEMWIILFDDMLLITRRKKGLHKKQSSLTEKWANSCSKGSTSSITSHESPFKYVVYKQPLSLDRFYIHDISLSEGAAHNLKHVFVLVCLNRFQQIVTLHTFQAPNESVKINWLSKLKDTTDKWKRTLQNTVFRSQQRLSSASVSTTASYRNRESSTISSRS